MQQFAGKKKGQKSGNTKKKNSKSKKMSSTRKTKSGGTDLASKLLSTMDKHKEVRDQNGHCSLLHVVLSAWLIT
jgi:hypothetical protein